jgi:hypothetical protein
MNNSIPLGGVQVPDLAALRGPSVGQDPGVLVAQMILGSAGVVPGGPSFVVADGESYLLDDTSVVVLFSQAGAQVFGITGQDTEQAARAARVLIPWHAIRKIGPRS